MDDNSISDSLPTLELVDRLKQILRSSGMDDDEVDHLNPVLITVIIKYMQQLDILKRRTTGLNERSMQFEFDNRRLRSQRDALRIALAKERVLRKKGNGEGEGQVAKRDLQSEYESFFGETPSR